MYMSICTYIHIYIHAYDTLLSGIECRSHTNIKHIHAYNKAYLLGIGAPKGVSASPSVPSPKPMLYLRIRVGLFACVYVCMVVCVHVCMLAYMQVYTHTHTHTHARWAPHCVHARVACVCVYVSGILCSPAHTHFVRVYNTYVCSTWKHTQMYMCYV
jgi:hypothetical protein